MSSVCPDSVCSHGRCDGEFRQVELDICGNDACVCIFTPEDFNNTFGTAPPTDGAPVGYVERDGEEGQGDEDSPVRVGDVLDLGTVVIIETDTECGEW